MGDVNDNLSAARAVGLRYVNDGEPGISRRRAGKGFRYASLDGAPITDSNTLLRIRALAVPPAWTDVWICASPRGHIQATGRDARGRKQYRYQALWSRTRDEAKFERTIAFARALPRLRRQVARDLRRHGLPRDKVVATVVRLLESTLVRVGNEEYARDNQSYGLTTLRNRHAAVHGKTLKFTFRGKSGVKHTVGVSDQRLARVVRRCQELPGQRLFEYVDEDGAVQAVTSDDVNQYIRTAIGADFSAKDFRTWAGTVLAARALRDHEPTQQSVKQAVARVAQELGNTPAVCRKCYIHPAIIDAHLDGALSRSRRGQPDEPMGGSGVKLGSEERLVLALLRRGLRQHTANSHRARI